MEEDHQMIVDCRRARLMMIGEAMRLLADMRILCPDDDVRWCRPSLRGDLRTALYAIEQNVARLWPRPLAKRPPGERPPPPPPNPRPRLGAYNAEGASTQAIAFEELVESVHDAWRLLSPSATGSIPETLASDAEAMLLLTDGGYARAISNHARFWAFADDLHEKLGHLEAHPEDKYTTRQEKAALLARVRDAWPNLAPLFTRVSSPGWLHQSLLWNVPDGPRVPADDATRLRAPNTPFGHPLDGNADAWSIRQDLLRMGDSMIWALRFTPERRLLLCEILAHTAGVLPSSLFNTAIPWVTAYARPLEPAGLSEDDTDLGEPHRLRAVIESGRTVAPPASDVVKDKGYAAVERVFALGDDPAAVPAPSGQWREIVARVARPFVDKAGALWTHGTASAERVLAIYTDLPLLEGALAVGESAASSRALDELRTTLVFRHVLEALLLPMGLPIAGTAHRRTPQV